MRINLFLVGILFLFSCNNRGTTYRNTDEDTLLTEEELSPFDKLIWISDYDTIKGEFFLKKQRIINADTLTAENLIKDVNAGWENVKIVFNKIAHDTLYVRIPNSDFLTQQMGNAGAESYIATTTYNLTELKGITFIHYDFTGGDHLSPGTFSRKDFENYR